MSSYGRTLNRRRFVAGAAVMGAAATFPLARSATARAAMNGRRVAVFGAGMSGLVVAHELVERGFEVDVYEANHRFGGKAASWGIPGTGSGGRKDLPGEHGFRFFPGFYQHVTDSMVRTPAPGRKRGVLSALRGLDDLAGDEDGWGLSYSESQWQTVQSLIRLRDYQRLPDPNALGNPADLVKTIQTVFGGLARPTTINRGIELAWFAARSLFYMLYAVKHNILQAEGRFLTITGIYGAGLTVLLVSLWVLPKYFGSEGVAYSYIITYAVFVVSAVVIMKKVKKTYA